MAENVPPNSASKAAATATTTDRGLAYYEKLRRDLRDVLAKKRILDRNMAAIEERIFQAESSYLEETSAAGNIIKGFDNYIKAAATNTAANVGAGTVSGAAVGGTRRKAAVSDADRVFSKSSVSYNRDSDSPGGGSAVSTPGGTGTPTGSLADKVVDKKKKKAATGADEDDTRSTKRQKTQFVGRKRDDD